MTNGTSPTSSTSGFKPFPLQLPPLAQIYPLIPLLEEKFGKVDPRKIIKKIVDLSKKTNYVPLYLLGDWKALKKALEDLTIDEDIKGLIETSLKAIVGALSLGKDVLTSEENIENLVLFSVLVASQNKINNLEETLRKISEIDKNKIKNCLDEVKNKIEDIKNKIRNNQPITNDDINFLKQKIEEMGYDIQKISSLDNFILGNLYSGNINYLMIKNSIINVYNSVINSWNDIQQKLVGGNQDEKEEALKKVEQIEKISDGIESIIKLRETLEKVENYAKKLNISNWLDDKTYVLASEKFLKSTGIDEKTLRDVLSYIESSFHELPLDRASPEEFEKRKEYVRKTYEELKRILEEG